MKIEDIKNTVIRGPALKVLKTMPSESIDCVMTSPPYWGLRDYGVRGQLGLEKSFQQYLVKLCRIFDEVKRLLKPAGSCWVNIGDTYSGGCFGARDPERWPKQSRNDHVPRKRPQANIPKKCLCQIPARFSIEMTNRGWILRNEIIWYKRNVMPSSVKDRFIVDYEKLFFFTKNRKYYFEQQLESQLESSVNRLQYSMGGVSGSAYPNEKRENPYPEKWKPNPAGRNKRAVWMINQKGCPDAHFSVYPDELCHTPIKAGCPPGGMVLDPFMGRGTTGLAAMDLNRNFIGIDINPDNVKLSERNIANVTPCLL